MRKKSKAVVAVEQDPDDAVPTKILAKAIVEIAEAAKKALASGLKEEAIVLLIHDNTKVGRPAIRQVLRCLPELADIYVRMTK